MLTTTAFKERQGLVAPLAEATKAVKPIDRTTLNAWEDSRIVDWVEKTGQKKLVIAGQWTEVCVAIPVLSALDAGYEVYVVTDACGGASSEAHDMAVERMVQAGAHPITTWAYVSELQRDWARAGTAEQVTKLFAQRGGAFGPGPALGVGPAEPQGRYADAGAMKIEDGTFTQFGSTRRLIATTPAIFTRRPVAPGRHGF
jgi:nicotinamidase-related amidase